MIVQPEEAKHELVGMRPDIKELGQASDGVMKNHYPKGLRW